MTADVLALCLFKVSVIQHTLYPGEFTVGSRTLSQDTPACDVIVLDPVPKRRRKPQMKCFILGFLIQL